MKSSDNNYVRINKQWWLIEGKACYVVDKLGIIVSIHSPKIMKNNKIFNPLKSGATNYLSRLN